MIKTYFNINKESKKGRLICFCIVNFKSKKVNVNKYSSFQLKENFKRSKNKMQKQTSLRIFGNIKKNATSITMKSIKHASLWNVDSKKKL